MVNHGERLASLEETVDRLRPIVETVPDQSNNLVQRLDDLDRRMRQAENDIANISRDSDEDRQTAAIETANIHGKFEDLQQERADDLAHQQHEADRLTAMQQTINDLTDKLNVVNAALQSLLREGDHHIRGAANLTPIPQKLKIPEPKPYDGSRDAKELEKVVNRHEPQVQATLRSNNQPSCHRPQKTGDAHHRVKTCQPCHKDKSDHSSQPGPSQPLHVPQRPWESVSLRFITGLPQVGNLASIMVVIDQFSDYATFIAAPQNISAEDTARLFFSHIVKHWGLPKNIVSRRDSRFTSNFWTHLFRCFGSTLSHNTDIHPPSDGQTDRFDDMLEEYLRNFATGSQKHWVKLLDAAQLSKLHPGGRSIQSSMSAA
uniref:Integrase catalytic domain-containing protein n=1 Tax=Nicotiana tabacum TaxID=4097 RepID=A0A1S4B699_TOBAC|nr:PREDICTED: uncharacterized protein LOC107804933 [Nicotiana tabacum]